MTIQLFHQGVLTFQVCEEGMATAVRDSYFGLISSAEKFIEKDWQLLDLTSVAI